MRLVHWVRFTWELDALSVLSPELPEHYHFTVAGPPNEKELRAVIARSFAHDTSWGGAIHEVNAMVDAWLESAFDPLAKAVVVALCHGTRIIGATIVVPDPAAEDQFAPGPCVQMEYRNRGLGTALLAEGLRRLQEAGLSRATTIARSNGPVAKFLYPKFAGVVVPGAPPLLAA
jgi:predicted N-acetyltransferase YhbS